MPEMERTQIRKIAVLSPSDNQGAGDEATEVATFLRELDFEAEDGLFGDEALSDRVRQGDFDLVISLGGDGSMLRAGHLCALSDVPLLGINFGHFGFLIELEASEWRDTLPRLVKGDYWFEPRMLLKVDLWRASELFGSWEALNEAMIGRGREVRPVHLLAKLDGRPLTTYVADGLILATPTGSTAYALAVGGPILPPVLRNILLVPVAPHLSVDRAIVLAEGASIRVEVQRSAEAVLSIDGQAAIDLKPGDEVVARASEHSLRFLRFQEPGYFYQRLIAIMDNNPAVEEKEQ